MKKFFKFTAFFLSAFSPLTLFAAKPNEPLKLLQPQQGRQAEPTAPAVLHDIYGPILLPEPFPYILYGSIAVAALLILAVLYWWFFKRQKPAPPPIPPSIIARDELMRAREMMSAEKALEYMDRVSNILRRYLESRFKLRTTRQTTRELFRDLATGGHPEHQAITAYNAELRSCLELCDMAKFAHRSAHVELLQEIENSVLNLVNTTESTAELQTEGGGK